MKDFEVETIGKANSCKIQTICEEIIHFRHIKVIILELTGQKGSVWILNKSSILTKSKNIIKLIFSWEIEYKKYFS